MSSAEAAAAEFVRVHGRAPDGVWCAPGRVNLIGEHTDYNGGLALPVTIDRHAWVAAGLRDDRRVRCASAQFEGVVHCDLDREAAKVLRWAAPVAGALAALARADRRIGGLDLLVDSAVPVGGGLASSAAVCVAACLALLDLNAQRVDLLDIARACQWGESEVSGAPTGLMDQIAVLAGAERAAVYVDFATLRHRLVPLELDRAGAVLLVIDTHTPHDNRDGGYRARREECAAAAARLGVRSLRQATAADADHLPAPLGRRVRHIVTENERVLAAVRLLEAGAIAGLGPVLSEGHASLRDDYDVSCRELDVAVAAAETAGAWGARLTGAGFGGSAVALLPRAAEEAVADGVRSAFAAAGLREPSVRRVRGAGAAHRCG